MDFSTLPKSGIDFLDWEWEQIKPYYDDLAARPIDAGSVSAWLADWNRVAELLDETNYRLYILSMQDTADAAREQKYAHFVEAIAPKAAEAEQTLKAKLLASGIEPEGFEVALAKMRWQAEIFREDNLPLKAEESRLVSEFNRIRGGQTVEWQGQTLNAASLIPYLEDNNRSMREQVWRLRLARWLQDKAALETIWLKLVKLRRQVAGNAGFGDYRAYRFKELLRLDYTPDDCLRFHEAIEQIVVPVAARLHEKRRKRLGITGLLRPWDWDQDFSPSTEPPLKPFQTVGELESKTAAVLSRVDPELAEYFETMRRENLLDLERRPGKGTGGFNLPFEAVKRPFIFFAVAGAHSDVETLLHEAGHACHTFESARQPYIQNRGEVGVPAEFAEVASMGMELLALPFIGAKDGGFYNKADVARALHRKLEDLILFWPYMSTIDSFQHWAHTNSEQAADVAACDAKWIELWKRFDRSVDWTGCEDFLRIRWRVRNHLFETPFYYVEYGLAQLGAVQVWANSLEDYHGAVAQYRAALRLGGSKRLPELYRAAGVKLAFDAETLKTAVDLIETKLEELEKAS